MSDRGILALPADEFEREFLAARLLEKRNSNVLKAIIVDERPATNPLFHGGVSRIVKLLTPNGQHIATLHEIVMADGATPHCHGKDYTRRDCSRVRPAEPEPPPA